MKKSIPYVLFVVILGITTLSFTRRIQTIELRAEKVEQLNAAYLRIIQTQAEHFKVCSFVNHDDVVPGHDGYLYSRTARDNKRRGH